MESCHKRCLRANNREGKRKKYLSHSLILVKLIGCIKGAEVGIKRDVNFQKEIETLKEKLVIEQ